MTLDKPIPELGLEELNRLYKEGEECDKRMFAEMRTNLQLVAGDHYVREGSKFWNRIRDNKQLSAEQRLKLTKNHIQRVTKIYRDKIESFAPGVAIVAANEDELQDQKSAELNYSYWQYIKRDERIDEKKSIWIKNFVEIGELHVKIFWEPRGGQVIGYEAEMDTHPETGEKTPMMDETGQPVQSDRPVYGGKIKYETFEGYNVRREHSAKSMAESPYIILSKIIPKKSLRSFITDEATLKKFDDAPTEEHTIYDNNTGYYVNKREQVLVKEIYFRPGPTIEKGYFYLFSDTFKIAEGKLPYGIFPVISCGFDEQTGNPRSHSVIRHCRPAQIEINRCASKIAEHQVTLADDKAWVPANTKVSQGAFLPGIRVNTYSGVKPEITPGRVGDQYFDYLDRQINELYFLANLQEVVQEQPQTSQDMYAALYQSFRFRQKFAIYGEKFERFLIELVETSLDLARNCCSEQELVPALGKSEYINIAEFKATGPLSTKIKVEARSDDIETQFGKQLVLNHFMQYIGPNLEKEDIGKMARLSPFLNKEKAFDTFTTKYDSAVNDILALDRGHFRPPRKYDDHKYIIQALTGRMSQSDYEFLPMPIQMLYDHKLQMHEQMESQNLIEIQKAQAGFIPSGGYMVACDFYQGDPTNPTKVKRVRIPSESIAWLIDKLKTQGFEVSQIMEMPQGAAADLSAILNNAKSMAVPPGEAPGGFNGQVPRAA